MEFYVHETGDHFSQTAAAPTRRRLVFGYLAEHPLTILYFEQVLLYIAWLSIDPFIKSHQQRDIVVH